MRQGLALALTLMPMSATALVLLADLRARHPELAVALAPVVLSAIAVHGTGRPDDRRVGACAWPARSIPPHSADAGSEP